MEYALVVQKREEGENLIVVWSTFWNKVDRPFPWVCWDLYCDGLVYEVCGHPYPPTVRGTSAVGDRTFQQYIKHRALACVEKACAAVTNTASFLWATAQNSS